MRATRSISRLSIRLTLAGSLTLAGGLTLAAGCASSSKQPRDRRVTVVKTPETPPPVAGVPPDKEEEVRLVLQQRDTTTRRCYQDALNQRTDRSQFQGTVRVLISLGTDGRARDVKANGGTLGDKEVEQCLLEAVRSFEYPLLTQGGDVQYEFSFRPAY